MTRAQRLVVLGAGATVWLAALPGSGHPTPDERARAAEARATCGRAVPADEDPDPVELGMTVEQLRGLFPSGVLHAVGSPDGGTASEGEAEGDGQGEAMGHARVVEREGSGDVARVHYGLWRGRVVQIHWQLAERFERPVLDALTRRATTCFGPPRLDQVFEAEPGSSAATYRRAVWKHGERRIELRQLHPLRGGAVHLAVGSRPGLRAMREAGVAPRPLPETTGPWWIRGAAPVVPPTPEEVETLGRAFLALLAHAAP